MTKADIRTFDSASVTAAIVELNKAREGFPARFNSAHEGFAVLKEEVDELWDEVKKNQNSRDKERMAKEAVQVAAMALRFITDVCSENQGGVS